MKRSLALLACLAVGCSDEQQQQQQRQTYLASLTGISLKEDERVAAFSLETWGVEFVAVCWIPNDWVVTAGSFGPGGRLAGQPGHGASYLDSRRMDQVRGFALIALERPADAQERRLPNGVVPATFTGHATIESGRDDGSRDLALTSANVELVPAGHCPARS